MSKIKKLILLIAAIASFGLFATPALAVYDPCHPEKSHGTALTADQLKNCEACQKPGNNDCLQKNPIVRDLNLIVDLLTGAVSLIIIGVIIAGGIQYAMAGGNANAIQAAKKRITNALIALMMFLLAWAFLQWLIPGGL